MSTREPDAFIRISADGDMVEICTSAAKYEATPAAAREIARNLMRKADEAEAKMRSERRGHLRRVK